MTQSSERETVWLTQAKYDELKAELAHLRGPGRQEVVDKVSAARDEGDLKENGGYHAAREELGKIDGRIAQLEDMLQRVEVGEVADDGVVEPGMVVRYRFVGEDDEETFLLGAREMKGDDDKTEVYSPQSPLGSAINGRKVGDTVEYQAPNGNLLKVEILEATPYTG